MKAKELAKEILAMIEAGELDPEAMVIRPFCMCDRDHGWIEVRPTRRPGLPKADKSRF